MKEMNDSLIYKLKGEITTKDEVNGIVETIQGKNADDINIQDFLDDISEWFANRTEGDNIDLSFSAKLIKK